MSSGSEAPAGEAPRLVLASRSPQRRAILRRLGVSFQACPPEVAELERGDPGEVALENALRKARAVQRARASAGAGGQPSGLSPAELVLGVDTVVAKDGEIYGKPRDAGHARRTLAALSGATHEVVSGLAVVEGEGPARSALARTSVTFRELGDSLLEWYLATGEWRERAGGYAIQGAGAALVVEVRGDYENVVGLPVATLLDLVPEVLPEVLGIDV